MSIEKMYLAFLTEKRSLGEPYKNSPQHLTLIPPFFAEKNDVFRVTSTVAQHSEPFTIKVDGEAFFGPKRDIPVVLVEHKPELHNLHKNLLQAMRGAGVEIVDDSYVGEDYQPHIAVKANYPTPVTGQEFFVDWFTVMLKTELARVALVEVMLSGKT